VATEDLSIIYGRVFPPASVADVDRIPGFLGVLGPDGPMAFSTAVAIEDSTASGPLRRVVRARGARLDVELVFSVERTERTQLSMTGAAETAALDFLQLSGEYHVKGRIADREVDFRSRGAAETFQPASEIRQPGSGSRQPQGRP
jgi:hypothetical protein